MKKEFEQLLDPGDVALWTAYRSYERHNQRPQALAALNDFVDRLLTYPQARREQFAAWVCHAVVDAGIDLPVRHPLFATILFPYLVRALDRHVEHAARWMAHFYDHLINWREGQKWVLAHGWDRHLLLREALERNPADIAAHRQLIAVMARRFDYAIHEVPAGVLYGINGASIEECRALRDELAQFRDLVRASGEWSSYAEKIHVWEYHFAAYSDYLAHHEQCASYAQYLNVHPPP